MRYRLSGTPNDTTYIGYTDMQTTPMNWSIYRVLGRKVLTVNNMKRIIEGD